jgi:hypothetical protein
LIDFALRFNQPLDTATHAPLQPSQNKTRVREKLQPTSAPLSMLRSWSELAQAKVPENKQDHDDYTDNVKYVVSTHVLPHFSGRTPIPEITVIDCSRSTLCPHVL